MGHVSLGFAAEQMTFNGMTSVRASTFHALDSAAANGRTLLHCLKDVEMRNG